MAKQDRTVGDDGSMKLEDFVGKMVMVQFHTGQGIQLGNAFGKDQVEILRDPNSGAPYPKQDALLGFFVKEADRILFSYPDPIVGKRWLIARIRPEAIASVTWQAPSAPVLVEAPIVGETADAETPEHAEEDKVA